MTHFKRTFIWLIALGCVLSTALTSCVDDKQDDIQKVPADAIYQIATFVSYQNVTATFKFQKGADTPVITLTAQGFIMDTALVSPGMRVLIVYKPVNGDPDASGDINLYAVGKILNGTVKYFPADGGNNFNSYPVNLESAWLTGDYINFAMILSYFEKMDLNLVCDEATKDSATPHLYLIFKPDQTGSSYPRSGYASFDISEIWDNGTAEAVTLTVNDSRTGSMRDFTFKKPANL